MNINIREELSNYFKCDLVDINFINIYRNDLIPQVSLVKIKNNSDLFKIRFTNDREYAVFTEAAVCNILKEHYPKSDFFPKIRHIISKHLVIYEYIKGKSIDKIINELTKEELDLIGNQLYVYLQKIHAITSSFVYAFDNNQFINWYSFFECKLYTHLREAVNYDFITIENKNKLIQVLHDNKDKFDINQNILLHFDIKPANIIYNKKEKKIYLIDFEMSRFGDEIFEYSKMLFNKIIYFSPKWDKICNIYFNRINSEKNINIFINPRLDWYMFYHYLTYIIYLEKNNILFNPITLKNILYIYLKNILET